MDPQDAALDELIAALGARAADPERRVDVSQSQFMASVTSLDIGGLFSMGKSVMGDLNRLLGQIRSTGSVSPDLQARAEGLERQMSTPVVRDLPPVATETDLRELEAELGSPLPAALRRAYAEVGDGGFGPGTGLLSTAEARQAYRDFRDHSPAPRGSVWPAGLLPIVHHDPGYDCVEAATGRVLEWDPEELTEFGGERQWQRSFTERAPSVEAWLGEWARRKPRVEREANPREPYVPTDAEIAQARHARSLIAEMTPDQRRQMGLPATGWERVVWGGIGLDEDEPHS